MSNCIKAPELKTLGKYMWKVKTNKVAKKIKEEN